MVESSTEIKQVDIVVPAPFTERGHRVAWTYSNDNKFMIYACKNNVVFRSIETPSESYIYTEHNANITCVSVAPKGEKFAIGDINGKVNIISRNEQGQYTIVKEHQILNGQVNTISWTDDGQRIIVAGAGSGVFAGARHAEMGSQLGEVLGHTQNVLASAVTPRPFKLFSAGEANEILVHEGVPFKGQAQKTIKDNTGYVNQIQLSPDNTHFATVSSDKTINLYDAKTWERVQQIKDTHKMGVYELKWLDNDTVITSSADNTVKSWNIKEGQLLKSHTVHSLPKTDAKYQQLGLLANLSGDFWSVTLNGNLNHWNSREDESVSNQLFGHKTLIHNMIRVQSQVVYASEERLFHFNEASPIVKEVHDHKHAKNIHMMASTDSSVYTADIVNVLCRSKLENGELVFQEFVDAGANVLGMGFDNENAYALLQQGKLKIFAIDTLQLKSETKLPFDATNIAVSKVTGEIWVSDPKNTVFVYKFDGELKEQHKFEKHQAKVTVLSVSADGKFVASGDDYRYIYVHDAESKAEVQMLAHHKSGLRHVELSADGSRIASMATDQNFAVVEVASKKEQIIQYPHGRKGVSGIHFSQDEQKVFTVGQDHSIRAWQI